MCSFMVSTDTKMTKETFKKGFKKIQYRGPDESRLVEVNSYLIGFYRLAIMGLTKEGMQPFTDRKSYLVCNGEIYGFRKIKEQLIEKGYKFKSSSDCEILLPLYHEFGVEMFKQLDAEFVCVIYDDKEDKFIAARDPMGIRPLFYGYTKNGKIVFASEAKSLIKIADKVMPFPPGHYYDGDKFVLYNDISKSKCYHDDDLETIFKKINEYLTDGIVKRLDADAPLGYLLSGGLDSSLVCSVAAKHSDKPIKTFAVGMDTDAIDLKYAKEVADYIKSDHTEVIMTKEQVINCLRDVIYHLETYDITTIRASVGMYLLTKWIKENTDIKVVLTGEVSDEMFGYKYTDFAPNKEEFQKESEKRIKELYMYDVLRADRCISGNSLEGRVPFADLKLVDYVMGIEPGKKTNTYNMGKYLLRKAFEKDYLPHNILYREKAAFSDAVGHSMVDYIKEYAEGYYTLEEYEEKIKKYKHSTPFTKESLLYREIFEEFYSGQSEMIVDFWMPNKEWEGCDVNDPSARVLKNYGASGI